MKLQQMGLLELIEKSLYDDPVETGQKLVFGDITRPDDLSLACFGIRRLSAEENNRLAALVRFKTTEVCGSYRFQATVA